MQATSAVRRVSYTDDKALYADVVRSGEPTIIVGAGRDWLAHHWTLDSLRARFGGRDFHSRGQTINLGAALTAIEQSSADQPAPYLRECYLPAVMPELLAEVSPVPGAAHNRLHARALPGMGPDSLRLGSTELLVAGRGTRFPDLHWDLQHSHAFIMQLVGPKRFWLYAPDQTAFMYPRADLPNVSAIDVQQEIDTARWPLFAQARGLSETLAPGELIFVPSGWWHYTRVESVSIAVTWNAVSPENWPGFVQDRYLSPTPAGLKRQCKSLYLKLIDAQLRLSTDA